MLSRNSFMLEGLTGKRVLMMTLRRQQCPTWCLTGTSLLLPNNTLCLSGNNRTDVKRYLRRHVHISRSLRGQSAANAAGARLQAALSMVSPTMKAVVDAMWAVWSIGASIYDYIHTNAMEERIHALENVITIHQCVIGLLSAGVVVLFTYILYKKI